MLGLFLYTAPYGNVTKTPKLDMIKLRYDIHNVKLTETRGAQRCPTQLVSRQARAVVRTVRVYARSRPARIVSPNAFVYVDAHVSGDFESGRTLVTHIARIVHVGDDHIGRTMTGKSAGRIGANGLDRTRPIPAFVDISAGDVRRTALETFDAFTPHLIACHVTVSVWSAEAMRVRRALNVFAAVDCVAFNGNVSRWTDAHGEAKSSLDTFRIGTASLSVACADTRFVPVVRVPRLQAGRTAAVIGALRIRANGVGRARTFQAFVEIDAALVD